MASFRIALAKTLALEGYFRPDAGYVNDPDDPGGETWAGISRRVHPEWPGWRKIDDEKPLTPEKIASLKFVLDADLRELYGDKYWPSLYGEIVDQGVANELFDFSVPSGVAVAVAALQRSLKYLVAGPIVADGKFGPQTLEAANAAEPRLLLAEFRAQQAAFYGRVTLSRFVHAAERAGILQTNGRKEVLEKCMNYALKFLVGWERRVMA